MKRIALVSSVLLFGLACDPAGFDPDPVDPVGDTDTDTDVRDTDDPNPITQGVQIGSEGIISECTTRSVGANDTIAGFSGTAQQVTDTSLQPVDGTLDGAAAGVPATLSTTAVSWAAVEGDGCPTLMLVGVDADLSADPELSATLAGWALIEPDRSYTIGLWASAWSGTATPVLDPADYDTVELRIDGTRDVAGFVGSVGFEACVGGTCTLEPYGTLAD
ncbi:MAG: hypothetical protein H6737_03275 [Alphaproteobacteria bacterium]|nr:hypothetical protein [Alphaproteobacteria bacterium]